MTLSHRDGADVISILDDEQRLRAPRDSGWEYMGREILAPAALDKIMAEAVANGRPENGGWELMLPPFTGAAGNLVLIFKRPLSNLVVARGTVPPWQPHDG